MIEVYINGHKWYYDPETQLLFEWESAVSGTPLYSNHVTPNERKQVLDQIEYKQENEK